MRFKKLAAFSFVSVFLALTVGAQTPIKDIASVFAEGKIHGYEYTNDYFGLTLTAVNAQFTEGGFVSSEGKRARLIDAQCNAESWGDKYEIAILADALSANPLVLSPEQYVRSVRHELEREGMVTVDEESPIEISGLRFVRAALKVTGQAQTHYQGIYTTFLNGYILSIQIEAPTSERLNQIVLSTVKFKN
jgi:hypothetical protein